VNKNRTLTGVERRFCVYAQKMAKIPIGEWYHTDIMDERQGCGAHGSDDNGDPLFDYTCDDCMLPEPHLDPPEM